MKKTFYKIAFAAVLGTSLVSCNKLLDAPVQSAMDESVIFSSPVLAEGAVAGILQSFGETNSYRGRYLVYYGINTDNEVGNSLKNTTDEKSLLANYQTNANNTQMNTDNNAWAKFYEAIERANLAIRGLRAYGNIENNAQLAQILGEVLVLRAVVYNDLVKGWGDVPARFEPLTSANTYVPRSDRDIIYKQILADLKEAENYLPWPNGNTKTQSVEKVNKAFAKGLRARIALAAGGYAQHADGVRLSRDPDLERTKMYQIAKEECLDVINSGTLRLLGFEEVFRTLCQETNLAGKESMWEIPFSEGRGRVLFDLGVKHTTTDKYTMQNKGGTNGPNPIMWYEYDKDDVRRAVSVVPYEWTNGKQVPTNLNKWYFGKYRYEWMKRVVTSTNDDGLNWMYMRYSDVVLMAAEAVNELDGPQAAAAYLKMIRDRAFPTHPEKVTAYMSAVTVSKEAFFNAIVDERSLEFTGEMLRKGDLIRWNLLSAKLNEAKQKLQLLENRQGRYAGYPKNIYYKTLADGESVGIYGLESGDTDAIGATYGTSKTWKLAADNDQVAYWDAMFLRDPNLQQFWPIWQFFIEASNGQLTNSGYNF
ncbi:RagB/SusD family nutrient uptake outer membrane protein [Sphingobacterium spiritivorum]|uniref:SusD family protein n=1 Tax=Sphingobacterium spiritivorum ATCC 33861 TaxID=525373 RepID=D7VMP2_SPHSI|nr:RagB/SusD family nutrient uptake outer membrane protein [Sphingobacterium spiritivorum]EFK57189.1 SusD family protein [Sphingobacterium spiritivorum ATCC 33861]QQT36718.1 RagB/SusD family nutrient uptake outer membrane protein [Sphingobacterium spiritivorum]WQD33473.1 RagB/SusD family nutrient uptake outer membrane protein [Sphingobacterium spiritivorum]SUJ23808.1 SusD family [Sphingobacterium spiritivorum]